MKVNTSQNNALKGAPYMNHRMDFHSVPDWKTPDVTSIRRVPSHTPWHAFADEASAAAFDRTASPYRVCLNGEYRFRLYGRPEDTGDFYRPNFDDSEFGTIPVPGNWELYGHGDPIYTNYVYPWSYDLKEPCTITPHKNGPAVPNPPHIPADNPTGCYRTEFTIPECFEGRDTYLRFDGVETACYVWINGIPVGYSEDSKLPCEFRITDSIGPGKNTMAVQVMKFASGSYLEDQDYWHLAGIDRSVWLISKPKLCIEDYKITAEPDLYRGGGRISADVFVSREPYYADHTILARVYAPDGTRLAETTADIRAGAEYRTDVNPTDAAGRIRFELPEVLLWSTESPSLYTITFTLLSPDGEECDREACRFGFKKLEVKNGVVYLNGTRLLILGVNRHDHCFKGGRTVSVEHMTEEIRQMKRMNINSVRTCHYPDNPEWYNLCDEYGILLVCECNLETHGVNGALSHTPSYAMNYVERAMRMVTTYKNHVSIYSWSLGNESGTGANHAAMYGFIKEYDKTRLCQYEAGDPGRNISDVRGWMYAPIDHIVRMLCSPEDDRPIILVEYLYQIRNSGGGVHKLRELMERYPRFQGGYIWDWQDKSLPVKTEDGREFFGYGGDFHESYTEPREPLFMTNNGIVQADLTWKPVAHEVKQAYTPVWVDQVPIGYAFERDGRRRDHYVLKNRTAQSLSGKYRCQAVLRENGEAVWEKEVPLPDLGGMEETNLFVDISYEKKAGCEYFIEFAISKKEADWYAESGYEIGFRQYSLPNFTPGRFSSECAGTNAAQAGVNRNAGFIWSESADEFIVNSTDSDGIHVRIRKSDGQIAALSKGEIPYQVSGPAVVTERGFTGMDANPRWGWYQSCSRFCGLNTEIGGAKILSGPACVRIEFLYTQSDLQGHAVSCGTVAYEITASDIRIDFAFRTDPETYTAVPRAGLEFILPPGFEALSYYGCGDAETYSDRMLAGKIKVCRSTVEEQHFPFSPISETGGHEQTRWLCLENRAGQRFQVTGDRPFHFDVHHNGIGEYRSALHDHELIRHPEIWLHIDAVHAPIGSDMAWSTVMPEELRPKEYEYRLGIRIELMPY